MADLRRTTLERAFALAKSGRFRSKSEIVRALRSEGLGLDALAQLSGRTLTVQINQICLQAGARGP